MHCVGFSFYSLFFYLSNSSSLGNLVRQKIESKPCRQHNKVLKSVAKLLKKVLSSIQCINQNVKIIGSYSGVINAVEENETKHYVRVCLKVTSVKTDKTSESVFFQAEFKNFLFYGKVTLRSLDIHFLEICIINFFFIMSISP